MYRSTLLQGVTPCGSGPARCQMDRLHASAPTFTSSLQGARARYPGGGAEASSGAGCGDEVDRGTRTCWFVRGQLVDIPGFRRHRSVGDLECRLAAGARGGMGLVRHRDRWRRLSAGRLAAARTRAGRCATGGSDCLTCGIGDRREGGRTVGACHPPRAANSDRVTLAASWPRAPDSRALQSGVSRSLLLVAAAGVVPWLAYALHMWALNREERSDSDVTLGIDHYSLQGALRSRSPCCRSWPHCARMRARSSPCVRASQLSTSGWCPSPGHTPLAGLAGRGRPSRSHGRSSFSPSRLLVASRPRHSSSPNG